MKNGILISSFWLAACGVNTDPPADDKRCEPGSYLCACYRNESCDSTNKDGNMLVCVMPEQRCITTDEASADGGYGWLLGSAGRGQDERDGAASEADAGADGAVDGSNDPDAGPDALADASEPQNDAGGDAAVAPLHEVFVGAWSCVMTTTTSCTGATYAMPHTGHVGLNINNVYAAQTFSDGWDTDTSFEGDVLVIESGTSTYHLSSVDATNIAGPFTDSACPKSMTTIACSK